MEHSPEHLLELIRRAPDDAFAIKLIAAFFACERSAGRVEAVEQMQAMYARSVAVLS